MAAAQHVLPYHALAEDGAFKASLPQWVIWQHAGNDGTSEVTAIPADQAFLFNAGSKCLGRVEAIDRDAALTQWDHREKEITWCVVEAHMRDGDTSDLASFAVFELTPVFLRNIQEHAARLSHTASIGNPIIPGKLHTPRTLTMAFDEPVAQVRWDNPDADDGHWEIVVHGDEQVLMYASIDGHCATTGMHLAELEKIFKPRQVHVQNGVTAYARPDSYEYLIEAIQASQGDTHMADISTVLDSALISAFYRHEAVETQREIQQRAKLDSAETPS